MNGTRYGQAPAGTEGRWSATEELDLRRAAANGVAWSPDGSASVAASWYDKPGGLGQVWLVLSKFKRIGGGPFPENHWHFARFIRIAVSSS